MKHYLVFAGTTEGRLLTEYLLQQGAKVYACVATEYGRALLTEHKNLTISSKPLEEAQMYHLMVSQSFHSIYDATHPYAVLVSKNIKTAANRACLPYYRILRPMSETIKANNILYVQSMEEAVTYFLSTKGSILTTTGSKELYKLCQLPDYQERVYARILPNPDMVKACHDLGFKGKHLYCMQGPFSEEMNSAILKQIKASFLLTKDSGNQGGFMEKILSANKQGVTTVVIGRPPEIEGITLNELIEKNSF